MFAVKKRFVREEPPQRIKEKMIAGVIYDLCTGEDECSEVVNLPAFTRVQNGIEIIKRTGMVDFYFKNRKKIVQFCRRNKI